MPLYEDITQRIKEQNKKENQAFFRRQKKLHASFKLIYGVLLVSDILYVIKSWAIGIVPMTLYLMGVAIVLEAILFLHTVCSSMTRGRTAGRVVTMLSCSISLAGYIPLMVYKDIPSVVFFVVRLGMLAVIGYILFSKKNTKDIRIRMMERLALATTFGIGLFAGVLISQGYERRVIYTYDHSLDGLVAKEIFEGTAPIRLDSQTVIVADGALKNAEEELVLPKSVRRIEEKAFQDSKVKTLYISSESIELMNALENSNVETVYLTEDNISLDVKDSNKNLSIITPRDSIDSYRERYRDVDYLFEPKIEADEMYIAYNGTNLPVEIVKKNEAYQVESPYSEELTTKTDEDGTEYLFSGWYQGDQEVTFPFTTNSSTQVSAVWSRVYKIHLISDGGVELSGEELEDSLKYTQKMESYTLPEVKKEGYRFCGWYNLLNPTTNIDAITPENASDMQLKAKFLKLYSVAYDSNGGILDEALDSYTIEDNIELTSPTRVGFTFTGWYDQDGYSHTSLGNGDTKNYELTARWSFDAPEVTVSNSIDRKYNMEADTVFVTPSHALPDVTYTYVWKKKDSEEAISTEAGFEVKNAKDSGMYTCMVTANYLTYTRTVETKEISVSIEKLTYDMSGLSFIDKEFEYNGVAQYPTVLGTLPSGIDGLQITVKYSGSATNVSDGEQTVTAIFSTLSENYVVPEAMTAKVKITPMPIAVTFKEPSVYPYDGEIHAPEAEAQGVLYGDEVKVTVTGGSNSIGEHIATAASINNSNYKLSGTLTSTYEIIKGDFKIKDYVSTEKATYVYDGKAHYPTLKGKLPSGVTPVYSDSITNVGTKRITISFKYENDTYTINDVLEEEVEVTPLEVGISWNTTSFIYNGSKQIPTASVTNAIEGDTVSIEVVGSEETKVGTYTATASPISNPNYKLPENNTISYSIQKADYDMSGVAFSNASVTYDGSTHTPTLTGILPTGIDGTKVSATIGEGIKNVGSTSVSVTFTGSENYNAPAALAATITITPVVVSLSWGELTHTYDEAQWKPTATAMGLIGMDTCLVTVEGANTDAGTYTARAASLNNPNYVLPKEKTASYTITKAEKLFDASFANTTFTYDGLGHTPVITNLPDGATPIFDQVVSLAGNTEITVSYAYNNPNYQISKTDKVTVTILQRVAELSWTNIELTYNGQPQAPIATVSNLVDGDSCLVSVSGAEISAGEDKTAKADSLSNENYVLPEEVEKEFTILKANYDMSSVSFQPVAYVYDGQVHKPSLSTLPMGLDGVPLSATIGEGLKNVGTKEVVVNFTPSQNYNVPAPMKAKVTITQKKANIVWDSLTNVYSGASWAPTATISGLVGSDSCTVTVSGAATNAGTYTATAYQLSNPNYQIGSNATTEFTITKAEKSITPTFATLNYVYDGNPHTPEVTGLEEGVEAIFDKKITNVGSETITVSYEYNNPNYMVTRTDSKVVTITPKEAELSWNYTTVTYTGEELIPEAMVTNLVGTDTCVVSLSEASNRIVGDYTATAVSLSNPNYVLPSTGTTHAYSIVKAQYDMSGVSFRNTSIEYDGTSHIPQLVGTLPTGADGTVVTVSYDKSQTNAGTVLVTASFKGTSNYEAIPAMQANITVTKKVVGLSWDSITHEYSGSSWAPTATATGLMNTDSCNVTVFGENQNAGTYTATAVSLDNENYRLPTNVTVTYTITKAELKFTPSFTLSFVYDGTSHTPVPISLPEGVTAKYSDSLTNAGTKNITVSYEYSSQNYKVEHTDKVTLEVTKREAVLSLEYTETVYTGEVQSPALTVTNLIIGDACNVITNTVTSKNVNTYQLTALSLDNENYKLPEVKIFDYSITKADYDMSSVVFENKTFEYDGLSHLVSATGLPTGADSIQITASYSVTQIQNAGSYPVTVTFTTESNNYKAPNSISATITVTQAPVTVEWNQASLVFKNDGAMHQPTATLNGILGGDTCNLTIDGGSNVNGQHTATASIDNSNYVIVSGETQTYVISEGEVDITSLVTFANATKEYNGKEQFPTLTGTLPDYVKYSYSTGQTNVGSTSVTITFTSNDPENHPVNATKTAIITVTPKTLAVSWTNTVFTYDGKEHIPTPILTGFVGSDVSDYTIKGKSEKAGGHTATIETLTNTNYQLPANVACDFTIQKLGYDMSAISFINLVVPYDGEIHRPEITGTLPVGKDDIQVQVSYSEGLTNAGAREVIATFTTASDNYEAPAPMKAIVTVQPKVITLNWTNVSFTYTGEVCKPTVTVSGTINNEVVNATLIGAGVDANTYTAEVTALDNSNYALPEITTKQFTIAKAKYDMTGITFKNISLEYDQNEHIPVISGTLPSGVSVSYTEGLTHVGTKTVIASFTGSKNYEDIPSMEAKVTITPVLITLTWEGTSFAYDGLIHTPTYTLSGVLDGDDVSVTMSGASKEVGSHTATVSGLVNTDYTLDATASKDYEITKGTYDMTGITFIDTAYPYDGQEHSISILGTLPTGGDGIQLKVSYTGKAKDVSEGEVVVTATFTTDSSNYFIPEPLTAKVSITPKTIGISWTGLSTVYDGQTHLPEASATGLALEDTCILTVEGQQTAAGTYTATVTELSNSNYQLPSVVTKQFTIAKAEYDMSKISFTDTTLTYNGESQHQLIKGSFVEGLDSTMPSVLSYTGSAKDVEDGEVTVTVSFQTTSTNYNVPKDMQATLSISPKVVDLSWGITGETMDSKSSYSFEYDTKSHSLTVQVDSSLYNEDSLSVTPTESFQNAGKYSIGFVFSNANYTANTTEVEITINKVSIYYLNWWQYGNIALYQGELTNNESMNVVNVFENVYYTYYDTEDNFVGYDIPIIPGSYYAILVSENTNIAFNCSLKGNTFTVSPTVEGVNALVDAIPSIEQVTPSDLANIRKLNTAYAALSTEDKAQIEDEDKIAGLIELLDQEYFFTGTPSGNMYTASGSTTDKYGTVSYAGLTLNNALKLETFRGSISFTANKSGTLYIVLGSQGKNTIKINGSSKKSDGALDTDDYYVVEYEVTEGTSYTLSKQDSAYLFYMVLL